MGTFSGGTSGALGGGPLLMGMIMILDMETLHYWTHVNRPGDAGEREQLENWNVWFQMRERLLSAIPALSIIGFAQTR